MSGEAPRLKRSRPPFAIVPAALVYDLEVSDRAVRLYAALDRYADKGGTAWPGRETLADALGCSVDSIDRAVRELVSRSWLTVDRRAGRRAVNLYTLHDRRPTVEPSTSSRTAAASPKGPGSRTRADSVAAPVRHERESGTRETPARSADASAPGVLFDEGEERKRDARDLTREHWNRCKAARRPTPVVRGGSAFVAVAKIVERLLEAGWSPEAVAEALDRTETGHTLQGLGVYLTRNRRPSVDESRATSAGRPDCSECGGSGWRFDDATATAVPCHHDAEAVGA